MGKSNNIIYIYLGLIIFILILIFCTSNVEGFNASSLYCSVDNKDDVADITKYFIATKYHDKDMPLCFSTTTPPKSLQDCVNNCCNENDMDDKYMGKDIWNGDKCITDLPIVYDPINLNGNTLEEIIGPYAAKIFKKSDTESVNRRKDFCNNFDTFAEGQRCCPYKQIPKPIVDLCKDTVLKKPKYCIVNDSTKPSALKIACNYTTGVFNNYNHSYCDPDCGPCNKEFPNRVKPYCVWYSGLASRKKNPHHPTHNPHTNQHTRVPTHHSSHHPHTPRTTNQVHTAQPKSS